jgi:predicted GIY-YIG superfamily endonuclease
VLRINLKIQNIMWSVYTLKCSDGTYYVGCTQNIEERMKRHYKGEISYIKT